MDFCLYGPLQMDMPNYCISSISRVVSLCKNVFFFLATVALVYVLDFLIFPQSYVRKSVHFWLQHLVAILAFWEELFQFLALSPSSLPSPHLGPGKLEDNRSSGGNHTGSTCINPCKVVCVVVKMLRVRGALGPFLFNSYFLKSFVCGFQKSSLLHQQFIHYSSDLGSEQQFPQAISPFLGR